MTGKSKNLLHLHYDPVLKLICRIGTKFAPQPAKGTKKYGLKGGCASEFLTNLNLPEDTAASIAKFGNLGVAQSTWNSYRTAQTMLLKCGKDTKENLEIPLDNRKMLIFIDWLARCRGLKSASITSYCP